MIGYYIARVYSKLLKNHEIIINYFRKCGCYIGKNVHIYSDITSSESYLISIGDDTSISNDVQFITHDNSLEKLHIGYSDSFGVISIGKNCFIGARAIIMGGVKLDDNCIVGAGSVVTKSFPEGSVIAGNPAKLITTVDIYKQKVLSNFQVKIEGLSAEEKRALLLSNKDRFHRR